MTKLYRKSQLGFFFFCLFLYTLVQNAGYGLSSRIGIPWSGTALLNLALASLLWGFLCRQHLTQYYGLCRSQVPARVMLWYLPLIFLSTGNLWNGVSCTLPAAETACYLVAMACVGFLEELLVRGFLFQYLKRRSIKLAVGVSVISFGAAHVLNLFSLGELTLAENLLQILSALCVGFLYAAILLRSGSLLPCILSHSVINMLFVFGREAGLSTAQRLQSSGIQMAIMVLYGAYLLKKPKPQRDFP